LLYGPPGAGALASTSAVVYISCRYPAATRESQENNDHRRHRSIAREESMPQNYALNINGAAHKVNVEPDTPLLYVLRNDLGLSGPRFGCGLSQCGACTVMVEGRATRSCVLPVGTLGNKPVTTLEGLGTQERPHPLQKAFMAEQAAQCGYCANGMIMTAKAFLDRTPKPTEAQVRKALGANLCRCGTHNRIVRAVLKASQEVA
jgi:nicotinate dehydrogenase subunit A